VADTRCALPLDCSDTYGELVIDGWSLHTRAWCTWNLEALFASAAHRGDNPLIEQYDGRPPRPLVCEQTDHSLPMMISGAVDRTDTAYANHAGGLLANIAALEQHLVEPIRTGTASLSASLFLPDPYDGPDLEWVAEVQPLRIIPTLLPNAYARAVLELRIPSCRFVPADGEGGE
jgi:hypothetical protein